MENFPDTKNNKVEEKRESILNDWDKKILLEGGEGVIRKIIQQDGIPDVIILPETSARPLYYLIDPSFKKIAEEQNTRSPKYIFFAPSKSDNITSDFESYATYNEEAEDIAFDAEIFEQYIKNFKEYKNNTSDKELIDKTFENKKNDRNRAKELLEKIKKEFGENPKIISIDEFMSDGITSDNIQRAFVGVPINGYSVFDTTTSNRRAGSGLTIPMHDTTEGYTENPSNKNNTILSYKNPSAKYSIGVTKENGNPIATTLRKTENFITEDQEKITTLRKEMKSLGEELASKF